MNKLKEWASSGEDRNPSDETIRTTERHGDYEHDFGRRDDSQHGHRQSGDDQMGRDRRMGDRDSDHGRDRGRQPMHSQSDEKGVGDRHGGHHMGADEFGSEQQHGGRETGTRPSGGGQCGERSHSTQEGRMGRDEGGDRKFDMSGDRGSQMAGNQFP
ncbi:unnamed protein product [Dicrocoelium dendriticum]|nr:unnamed protein product [Dicrocoelium dendriticum]